MTKEDLYQELFNKNGRYVQCLKAIEEACEFSQALAKFLGEGKGLASLVEETADLKIMIEQMEYIWGISEEVKEMMNVKLARQEVRMYGEN